jgi:AraC family transcriptional regulator
MFSISFPHILPKKVTLGELAEVAGLTAVYFALMFTDAVGVSPHRYVSRLRLENATNGIALA